MVERDFDGRPSRDDACEVETPEIQALRFGAPASAKPLELRLQEGIRENTVDLTSRSDVMYYYAARDHGDPEGELRLVLASTTGRSAQFSYRQTDKGWVSKDANAPRIIPDSHEARAFKMLQDLDDEEERLFNGGESAARLTERAALSPNEEDYLLSQPPFTVVKLPPRAQSFAPLVERIGTGYCVKFDPPNERIKQCTAFSYDFDAKGKITLAVVPTNKFDLPVRELHSLTLVYRRNAVGNWVAQKTDCGKIFVAEILMPGNKYYDAFEALNDKKTNK